MACYHPILAYRGRKTSPTTGKRPLVFKPQDAQMVLDDNGKVHLDTVQLPCGWCRGCRAERGRQWSLRIMHEAALYRQNCVVTLTYNDSNLPEGGSLDKRSLQLFLKRLRKHHGEGIRFFACGEYGANLSRPHYHVCLFNFDFADKVLFSENTQDAGRNLFVSADLAERWPYGFSTVGVLTAQSAAYVARYVLKKVSGKAAERHYEGRVSEFCLMSRGGRGGKGLARGWFEKYYSDCYPKGFVTMDGFKHQPPKYYDSVYEKMEPERFAALKEVRKQKAIDNPHNSGRRLLEREAYQEEMDKSNLRRFEAL